MFVIFVIVYVILLVVAAILACIAIALSAIALVFASLLFFFLIFSLMLSAMMIALTAYCFFKPEKRLRGALMLFAGGCGTLLLMTVLLILQFIIHSLRPAAPWILLIAPGFGFGWPAFGVAFPFFLVDVFHLIFKKTKSPSLNKPEIESHKKDDSENAIH
jgi:hypothetical protein